MRVIGHRRRVKREKLMLYMKGRWYDKYGKERERGKVQEEEIRERMSEKRGRE